MDEDNRINPVEIEKEFREKASKVRPFGGFFDWPNKETKELGVVKTLVEAVGAPLDSYAVRPGIPDPPDAIGTRPDGKLVAIEVTELVDQELVALNVSLARKGDAQRHHRDWDRVSLIAAIAERLTLKDAKALNGGSFEEYLVVLHTDEAMLTPFEVGEWLSGHTFLVRQITGAYLLFSYDGRTYPYLPISVSGSRKGD